jgi:hypothetical protein
MGTGALPHWTGASIFFLLFAPALAFSEESSAERGGDYVRHRPLNPPIWSLRAYQEVWKQWGLNEKPADYGKAFRVRYGLVEALFENQGLPLGLVEAPRLLGKGVSHNCLICHAGRVAGQTIIGMGNVGVDIQSLFEDLSAAEGFALKVPFRFSHVRGTIDPDSPVAYLMQFRDLDLNLRASPAALDMFDNVCSDPPAWWLLKRKTTRDWTGGIDARSTRIDMANLLTPLNSGARIREQEPIFAEIHAFVLSVQPPRYPFAVDGERAARGKKLFVETCRPLSRHLRGRRPLSEQDRSPGHHRHRRHPGRGYLAQEPGVLQPELVFPAARHGRQAVPGRRTSRLPGPAPGRRLGDGAVLP